MGRWGPGHRIVGPQPSVILRDGLAVVPRIGRAACPEGYAVI